MMKEILERNRYLTTDEASQYLSLCKGTIYNLVCSGKLKSYKIGQREKGSLRFTLSDLDKFVGRNDDNKKNGQ